MFSELHIKRDASYIAPASMDIKDIYNRFEEPIVKPSLNIEEVIHKYFRACPPHQSDSNIGYIVFNDVELHYVEDQDKVQLPNIDTALQAGCPHLCQHIHLHQQATDAIKLKITSTLLLGLNDKVDNNWKRDYPSRTQYLVAILIKVDEPQTSNLLRPSKRESSQHQEFELNKPTLVPPLHINSIGQHLITIKGPTAQNFFDKINNQAISRSHSVRSDIDQRTSDSQPRQPLQPRHHLVEGTSPHRGLLPAHVARREVAGANYIDIKDDWWDIKHRYLNPDSQHRALQRSNRHHQVQRQHGHRLTSEAHQDLNEPISSTLLTSIGQSTFSVTSDEPQQHLASAEYMRRDINKQRPRGIVYKKRGCETSRVLHISDPLVSLYIWPYMSEHRALRAQVEKKKKKHHHDIMTTSTMDDI